MMQINLEIYAEKSEYRIIPDLNPRTFLKGLSKFFLNYHTRFHLFDSILTTLLHEVNKDTSCKNFFSIFYLEKMINKKNFESSAEKIGNSNQGGTIRHSEASHFTPRGSTHFCSCFLITK